MTESLVVFMQTSSGINILHQNYQYITLSHPRSGPSIFLLEDGNIFELQKVALRKLGCVFVDQKISSDSNVYIATALDPRYLLLPFLSTAAGKYSPLIQILPYVEGCSQIPLKNINNWKMSEVCDVNDKLGDDMILYKYNETKALEWLRLKVQKVATIVAKKRKIRLANQQKTCVDSFVVAAQSEKKVQSAVEETSAVADTVPEKCDLLEAIDIISDYVTDDMARKLPALFSFETDDLIHARAASAAPKRKADWETAMEIERETLHYQGNASTAPSNSKPAPPPPGPKAKAQKTEKKPIPGAQGTKSISSFFSKK